MTRYTEAWGELDTVPLALRVGTPRGDCGALSVQCRPCNVGDAREYEAHAPDHQPHLSAKPREPYEHYSDHQPDKHREQEHVVGGGGPGSRIIPDAIPQLYNPPVDIRDANPDMLANCKWIGDPFADFESGIRRTRYSG